MNIKILIKELTGVEVDTEDLLKLLNNPEDYVKTPEDGEKLSNLLTLLELSAELEVNPYV